jgi:hypothetical protein
MQNLRCVLVATVRGARGSCVLLLIGLTTPSCADVTGRQHQFHPPGWASAPMKTLDHSSIPPAEALKELKEYAENLVANEEEDAASV